MNTVQSFLTNVVLNLTVKVHCHYLVSLHNVAVFVTGLPRVHLYDLCNFSTAMVKALKALQEKIRGLELDRVMAVEKFNHLSDETERCGQLLQNGDRSLSPSAYLMSTTGRESYGWLCGHIHVHVASRWPTLYVLCVGMLCVCVCVGGRGDVYVTGLGSFRQSTVTGLVDWTGGLIEIVRKHVTRHEFQ